MDQQCPRCHRNAYGNHLWWIDCPNALAKFDFNSWIKAISDSIRLHNTWFAL